MAFRCGCRDCVVSHELRSGWPAIYRGLVGGSPVQLRAATDQTASYCGQRREGQMKACILFCCLSSAFAQYSVRREGEVVRLEDAKSQTVVSVMPSHGNS